MSELWPSLPTDGKRVVKPEPTAADMLAKLHATSRIPPADLVGKLDKGYGALDYLGHAAVTDILLATDPLWDWEPVAWTDRGMPAVVLDKDGWPVGMWIRLTVHGHARLGYGTCRPGKEEAIKELIGDALRNAAMRFGVGLSLWAKEEWSDLAEDSRVEERPQPPTTRGRTNSANVVSAEENEPRPGNNSPTLPMASDSQPAPPRRRAKSEPLLKQDQALAKQAGDLGLDDETRRDVIHAITKGRTRSGKDLEPAEVIWVATAYEELASGVVELRYDPDGTPRIGKPRPLVGNNPGPTDRFDDEPF